MQEARKYTTMTEAEARQMEMALAGLDMGPNAAEHVLAESQVHRFLEALHNRMEADGVTQAELARRMAVQPNQIRRWLSTESSMRASTMFLLARMMGYELKQEWVPIQHAAIQTVWHDGVRGQGLGQNHSLNGEVRAKFCDVVRLVRPTTPADGQAASSTTGHEFAVAA